MMGGGIHPPVLCPHTVNTPIFVYYRSCHRTTAARHNYIVLRVLIGNKILILPCSQFHIKRLKN